jgi:hypothetical protein
MRDVAAVLQDEDFLRDLGAIGPTYKERLIEISKLVARS